MSTTASSKPMFKRQPLSPLGRTAFWSFFTITLLASVLVSVLAFFAAGSIKDSLTLAIIALIATILAAVNLRWTTPISSILGIVMLYMAVTEPFAIEHLTNPKAPQGGFGPFVGDVITIACLLLAVIASIGTTLENFRQGERKAPHWLSSVLSAIAGMAIGALIIGAIAQPATTVGTTFTNGVPTVHMNAGDFDQSSVTIAKGSKLLLVADNNSVHIIANGSWQNGVAKAQQEAGAPVVNNIQFSGNSIEIGPFTTAGTYHIYCSIHQNMNLTIIVQ